MVYVNPPQRIGVVLMPRRRLNDAALRFLILVMNSEQDIFQFEFYNPAPGDPMLTTLLGRDPVTRTSVRDQLPEFADRMRDHLSRKISGYKLVEEPPQRFIVIAHCCFDDNFYSTRRGDASVVALGNWKRYMAPPSLLEFAQMLLVREAVATLCPSLRGSVHLGNKGCLLDFTELLSEVRQKALRGYVCHFCGSRMHADGQSELADTVTRLLGREWLGSPSDPRTPAGVAANLGYDLFIAKGVRATPREAFLTAIRQEGAKQIVTVISGIALAAITFWIGLKTGH